MYRFGCDFSSYFRKTPQEPKNKMPQQYPGTRNRTMFTRNMTNKAGATSKPVPSATFRAATHTHAKLRKADLVKLVKAEHKVQEKHKQEKDKRKEVDDAAEAAAAATDA